MQPYRIPFWKTAPFCRLLLPLLAGIVLQWYTQIAVQYIVVSLGCFTMAFLLLNLLRINVRFQFKKLQGVVFHLLIVSFAMLLVWQHDTRQQANWYGHLYRDSCSLVIQIAEPLIEKEHSYKADGFVEAIIADGKWIPVKGKVLVYLSKDSTVKNLQYGSRILLNHPLQAIRNSGNPGAFNYQRYAAFHHVFHQVFLKPADWVLLPGKNANPFHGFIFSIRQYIIQTLQQYIRGGNHELGIAEALLIGYKEDLDKDLVQAYSNAGVVHIIAISGLHLGLIYVMLAWILGRLPIIKKSKSVQLVLLLGSLWLFAILTGSSGSVLRSAVMFTFIVIGKAYFKQCSIYNSLAGSAFFLLCYNPYLLWDVGFQLSYLAIIGIVSLQQPINRLLYIKQKWIAKIWGLFSVTLAAQVATFPLCIYYFHQFPNLFFITNLIAVPLSTILLFTEILLIAISGIPLLALYLGKAVSAMAWLMNQVIVSLTRFSFSVWDNIYANMYTTWFLYMFILAICLWMLHKIKQAWWVAMAGILVFSGLHVYAMIQLKQQVKLIVYNIPKCRAIDFVYQDSYHFYGDSTLLQDGMLRNFHLKPARIALQIKHNTDQLPGLSQTGNFYHFFSKRIMLLDTAIAFEPLANKVETDVLVISKNPSIQIADIATAIRPSMIVFDASNSLWKIAKWKKECLALALPCFSIPEQGAFVLNVD